MAYGDEELQRFNMRQKQLEIDRLRAELAFEREAYSALKSELAKVTMERDEARKNGDQLILEATDFLHAVSVLFAMQPEGDCLAERKPSKDDAAYRAFAYLNDQGKLLRRAIDVARKEQGT